MGIPEGRAFMGGWAPKTGRPRGDEHGAGDDAATAASASTEVEEGPEEDEEDGG